MAGGGEASSECGDGSARGTSAAYRTARGRLRSDGRLGRSPSRPGWPCVRAKKIPAATGQFAAGLEDCLGPLSPLSHSEAPSSISLLLHPLSRVSLCLQTRRSLSSVRRVLQMSNRKLPVKAGTMYRMARICQVRGRVWWKECAKNCSGAFRWENCGVLGALGGKARPSPTHYPGERDMFGMRIRRGLRRACVRELPHRIPAEVDGENTGNGVVARRVRRC
jgi:hypothetical protein